MIVIIVRNAQKKRNTKREDDEGEAAENQSIIICAALYFRDADRGMGIRGSSRVPAKRLFLFFVGRLDTSERLIEGEIGPFWPNQFDR